MHQGQSPPGSSYNEEGKGVPFFQGKAEFGSWSPEVRKWTTEPTRLAQVGDILLSIRAPVGPTNVATQDCCIGRGLAALRPTAIDQRYLLWYLRASESTLAAKATGSTFTAISGSQVREHLVPVAPRNEQIRIVAAIENSFTHLDAAVKSLNRVRAQLTRYRASVLVAACKGTMPGIAPEGDASALVRSLAQHRTTFGGRFGDTTAVEGGGFDLPAGWKWLRVKDVGEVQLGRQRSPKHHTGPHMRPYLRVANVFEDRIDQSDVLSMNFTPQEYETYRLRHGDILLNEGQTPELVGRPAMYRGTPGDVCFQNTLVRFRAYPGIEPAWALAVFRAYLHMLRFKRLAQITTNIAHLGAGRFAEVEFPVPPTAMQQQIVAEVERQLSVAIGIEREAATGLAKCAQLRQGILKKAFEGRLVAQDARDEPASAMLQRMTPVAVRPAKRRHAA